MRIDKNVGKTEGWIDVLAEIDCWIIDYITNIF